MKIALVSTPWSSRSGIADYTRHLLPYLREGAEVDLFVEVGREGEPCGGESMRSVADLRPLEYDSILYQLGNEAQHAFMAPMVRNLGGTVMLHDWVLFDLALAAQPALQRGGWRAACQAYQEGGLAEARTWWRARHRAAGSSRGWFPQESGGRWSGARACLTSGTRTALRFELHAPAGKSWTLMQGHQVLCGSDEPGDAACEVRVDGADRTAPELHVPGARAVGRDARQLGIFLHKLEQRIAGQWCSVDLDTLPLAIHSGLCDARFELSLNHSIVRHADAFLVHSDVIGERILESRNSATPICRVQHGAQPRWDDAPRESTRKLLGLPDEWSESFLLASFGALQAHKRPDVLLEALAIARARGVDARLICIGESRPAEFDLQSKLEALELEDCVHVTGWLPEEEAWRALHAANLCVNLRGPSTGGVSGGACQALSMGRAVIVSDLPELAHLPGRCVMRIPHGQAEVQQLANKIEQLCGDRAHLRELEAEAREVVSDQLHWRHTAERYLDALSSFPRARASRRSLMMRFIHATAKQRRGTGAETSGEAPETERSGS